MHLQQLTLCFATFLLGCYAIPNNYEGPEAFNKVLVGRQVGGVSRKNRLGDVLSITLIRIATSPERVPKMV